MIFRRPASLSPGRTSSRRLATALLLTGVVPALGAPSGLVPLPRASLGLALPLQSSDGKTIVLPGGYEEQLAVGMVLDLIDSTKAVTGRMRLTVVEAERSQGVLIEGRLPGAGLAAAVAPYPLSITRLDGNLVDLLLPRGNRTLSPGDILAVVRDGKPIARLRFSGYQPISATIVHVNPGETLRANDVVWAYDPDAPASAPLAHSLSTPPSNPAPASSGNPAPKGTVPPTDIFASPGGAVTPPASGTAASGAAASGTAASALATPSFTAVGAGSATPSTDVFAPPASTVPSPAAGATDGSNALPVFRPIEPPSDTPGPVVTAPPTPLPVAPAPITPAPIATPAPPSGASGARLSALPPSDIFAGGAPDTGASRLAAADKHGKGGKSGASGTRLAKASADAGRSLSRSGATGLIRMPSAEVTGDGQARIGAFSSGQNSDLTKLGNTTSYAATIGILPHTEIGVTVGNERQVKDLTFNAKAQLLTEKSRRPALAVGVAEIKKLNQAFPGSTTSTYYAAAGKHILKGRVNLTAGVQHRGGKGTKPFGGIEAGIVKNVSAVVEHDGSTVNYGLRASFLRDHVQVSAQHLEGHWQMQGGVRLALGTRGSAPDATSVPRLAAGLTSPETAKAVQKRLIALGLENVEVRLLRPTGTLSNRPSADAFTPAPMAADATPAAAPSSADQSSLAQTSADVFSGNAPGAGATALPSAEGVEANAPTIEIVYENRSFPHNELDALANVLAAAAAYAPDDVERASVIIKRSAIPILRIACPLSDYRRFMAGQLDASSFAPVFQVDHETDKASGPSWKVVAATGLGASSYGHADVFLRPGLSTALATEDFEFGGGLNLQPELNLPLARGVNLDARGVVPLAGPLKASSTTYDRLALNVSARLARPLIGRVFLGRFPTKRDGVLAEAVYTPDHSLLQARLAAGYVNQNSDSLDGPVSSNSSTFIGETRYDLPHLDANIRVSGGRYIEGDTGFTVGFLRRFGDTDIGLEVRDTSRGRAGVLTLGIPLGPSYLGTRPTTLRVRPPDFLDYGQRSLLTSPNFVDIANLTGNELNVSDSATRSLLDRDRLHSAYILRSLAALRRIEPLQATSKASTKSPAKGKATAVP